MMRLYSCLWKSISSLLASRFIPPLTNDLYKGQMGRIGVIGGSPDYCGAPYYSGEAALRFGADLCSIYCAEEAALPIKSYSPELMVTPFYSYRGDLERNTCSFSTHLITKAIPRLHSFVIGPGLGRDEKVLAELMVVLETLLNNNKS